jgi:hypothetical protein
MSAVGRKAEWRLSGIYTGARPFVHEADRRLGLKVEYAPQGLKKVFFPLGLLRWRLAKRLGEPIDWFGQRGAHHLYTERQRALARKAAEPRLL